MNHENPLATEQNILITNTLQNIQESIISQLEQADGKGKFGTQEWQRQGGGGGKTRLLVKGDVFEKGGVNYSAVHGKTPEAIQRLFSTEATHFFATGVSIVIHPLNPFVPITHMNIRYFELSDGKAWFGGGIDLTPAYVFEEDARYFHSELKRVCGLYGANYYSDFKEQADNYFFIKHRGEMRGIGGIFYDRQEAHEPAQFNHLWAFTQAVGDAFAPIYLEIVEKRKRTPWNEEHKNWQLHRRSRYVEFNLVYDSGTKFGLETNGRTESILMSMPPLAMWETDYQPEPGSPEAISTSFFQKGIEWA